MTDWDKLRHAAATSDMSDLHLNELTDLALAGKRLAEAEHRLQRARAERDSCAQADPPSSPAITLTVKEVHAALAGRDAALTDWDATQKGKP